MTTTGPQAQIDEFLELVRKSGLFDAATLSAYVSAHGPAQSARALAAQMIRDSMLTHFQARMLLEGKHKGFVTNGKYRVLELIAVGGMGSIYLCEHLFMKRLVALKVLSKDQQPAGAAERFLREARAAAALDHPNLVRAFDVDMLGAGPAHCLIMEFAEGVNLQHLVEKRGAVGAGRAAEYAAQAAAGLAHAHAAGLVHRDIKPANILLTRQGVVKVLDLGLARFSGGRADNLTQETANDAVLGTVDYMAPEQAAGDSAVGPGADVYSLGCTLYFLLAGQPPYPTGTAAHKLIWHQTAAPAPVGSVAPGIPDGLAAVVHKMLAKRPADRYPDMRAVAAALAPFRGPVAPPDEGDLTAFCPAVRKLLGDAAPAAAPSASGLHDFPPPLPARDPSGVRSGGSVLRAATIDLGGEVTMWRGRPVNEPTGITARNPAAVVVRPASGLGSTPAAPAAGPRGGPWAMVAVAVAAAVLGIAGFAAVQSGRAPDAPAAGVK
jgi:hypothetical protein